MRGAVLGDETAVAMAGCNTSSHCRGWLEGSEHTGSFCVYIYSYIYSWHVKGKQFHVCIAQSSCYLFIFDWRGWMRCVRGARCAAGLKVDLTDSLLNNMEALRLINGVDWSRRPGGCCSHPPLSLRLLLNRWKSASVLRLSSTVLLADLCTLLIRYCSLWVYSRHQIWGQTWCLGLPSQMAKSCVLLILFSAQYMEELIRKRWTLPMWLHFCC